METRLDWELEGVSVDFELNGTGDDCGLDSWEKVVGRDDGVVP